jgi:hypothetical protein
LVWKYREEHNPSAAQVWEQELAAAAAAGVPEAPETELTLKEHPLPP